jgi:hypothetical protein
MAETTNKIMALQKEDIEVKPLKCVCGSDLFMEKFILNTEEDTDIRIKLVACSFCGKILPSSRDRYKRLQEECQA